MKTCPTCAEIQPAVICRQCGSAVGSRGRDRSWALMLGIGGLALAVWFAMPAGADGRPRDGSGVVITRAEERCPGSGSAVLPPGHPPVERELPPGHPPLRSGPQLPPGHPPIDGTPAAPNGRTTPVTPIPKAKPFIAPEATTVL